MAFSSAANANCTPTAANNVVATCTGVTSTTYGTGVETGVNVTVAAGATVSGNPTGINVADGTFVTNIGSRIVGTFFGLRAQGGDAVVTNSGAIYITTGLVSGGGIAIYSTANATVVNMASGSIAGGSAGVFAGAGSAKVTNSGSVSGVDVGVLGASVTATNNLGATITGGLYGMIAGSSADITNSGSITGTANHGIYAGTDATVTNNAGASIKGGTDGILASGAANVTNSGSITGAQYGILTLTGAVNLTNSGSIVGTTIYGISAGSSATVINNAGASITGSAIGLVATNHLDVTNSGSITGTTQAAIAAGASATVVNNAGGVISALVNGIFAGAGGSSVFNAGTISGGTNAIQFTGTGNTLTLAPGSVISGLVLGGGSDTFQLGGTGAATFDVSQLGAAAQYQGFGTFNKIDSSVWTLTGTSTYAGAVNVNGGTLAVNGDISAASLLTVNAGGTLGGNGTVGNTLINGGTLAPGNSIGILTASSLTLTAASTYLVQVSGISADKTIVTGTANLAGKVVVDPLARLSATTTYTIMTAGTVHGAFSGAEFLTSSNFARNARLSYVGNDVLLTLDAGLLSPALPGYATINQKNVAAGIDAALAGGGTTPAGFNALFALSGDPLLKALTQASGETATGSQQTTFDAMNQFMGVLTDPFVAGRGDPRSSPGGATGYAADDSDAHAYASGRKRSGAEREAYAAIYRKAPLAQVYEPRWSVWATGFGGSQTTDGNAALGSNNTKSSLYGTAVGADYRVSPDTLVGFALAGGGTNFAVANNLGGGRSDLFQAGAFVRHNADAAYLSGALAYGWQDITTDRTVTVAGIDRLRAEFKANAWSGRLEGGYRFVSHGFGLTPYAAGQFTTFDLPAYAEAAIAGSNMFALAYNSKSVTDTRGELGLRTDKSFALHDGVLTLRGRAAWAHDFNPDRSIGATFQTLPGASFVVNGAAQASNSALVTGAAEMKWLNGWSTATTFEGEFSNVTRSYAGKGVVRYQW